MAPLDSDYSGASTCRSLQSDEGGFALLPRQPGMELAQPHLFAVFLFPVSYLSDRPSLSQCFDNFPHLPGDVFDLSNRATCRTKCPSQWRRLCAELREYTAVLISIRLMQKHGPAHRHAARVLGKPDFPVGWSAVGRLFKGKSQAKEKND